MPACGGVSVPFHVTTELGGKSVVALGGEVDFGVGLGGAAGGAHQARLAIVAEDAGRNRGAGHVVGHGELDVGVAGDLAHGSQRSHLRARAGQRCARR